MYLRIVFPRKLYHARESFSFFLHHQIKGPPTPNRLPGCYTISRRWGGGKLVNLLHFDHQSKVPTTDLWHLWYSVALLAGPSWLTIRSRRSFIYITTDRLCVYMSIFKRGNMAATVDYECATLRISAITDTEIVSG